MKAANHDVKSSLKALQKELAFLYRVTQTVYGLKLEKVLEEIVAIASQVTAADSCLVYLLDKDKRQLVLKASKNPHADLLEKIHLKLGEGITGWVAREKKPVAIAAGARHDPRFRLFRSLPEDHFEAFLSVPILNKHEIVGVINVQHRRRHEHAPMEVNLLTAMGKLVGGAVENALLAEETLNLKEVLELRKIIARAKGILMKRKNLSEDQAYKTLQKESMNTRKTIREVAEAVIMVERLAFKS